MEEVCARHPDVAALISASFGEDGRRLADEMRSAEVVVGFNFPRDALARSRAPKLRLLHVTGAGVEQLITHLRTAKQTGKERDELAMVTRDAQPAALKQGEAVSAKISLSDGRVIDLPTTVDTPRPRVTSSLAALLRRPVNADALH